MTVTLSFKPKIVTKTLISGLNERTKDIILQRYGIGDYTERKTLEEIGERYGITRERIRQLVNYALNSVKTGKYYSSAESAFAELHDFIYKKGGILSEREIFERLAKDMATRNHIYFLLVLADEFIKIKEDETFHHRWTVDRERAEKVHEILSQLHLNIKDSDLIKEKEMIALMQNYVDKILQEKIKEEILLSWLRISKLIDRNPLGEWGKITSENIRPRGVRDLAFLVFRKHGSPLHFNEVAKSISENFSKEAHHATVHNELIKDDRFVLVGRGVYALKDWGYAPGTVSDVIRSILKREGQLSKEEVIKTVLKERHVKENTILVNLQNSRYFKRNPDGTYKAV